MGSGWAQPFSSGKFALRAPCFEGHSCSDKMLKGTPARHGRVDRPCREGPSWKVLARRERESKWGGVLRLCVCVGHGRRIDSSYLEDKTGTKS